MGAIFFVELTNSIQIYVGPEERMTWVKGACMNSNLKMAQLQSLSPLSTLFIS